MLNVLWVYGQTQDPTKINVVHPSPEASAFKKYIDIPVNSYTGVPKIDIPIFTLQSGDVSLPISLSYHAAGLKVEEQASRVGAGWTLNAGGSISRSVVGKPDENGYFHPNNLPFFKTDQTGLDYTKINQWFNECNGITGYPLEAWNSMNNVLDGCADVEPDEFYISLPNGKSGRFGFDRLQNIHFFPHQLLNVVMHPFLNISSGGSYTPIWQIFDENGFIYMFEAGSGEITTPLSNSCNTTLPSPCNQSDNLYPTTWYLTRIQSPNGDYVSYSYENEEIEYESVQESFYNGKDLGGSFLIGYHKLNDKSFCVQKFKVFGKRLKTINSNKGQRVEFIYDTQERLDLKGSRRLKTIQIYENQNSIKYFQLHQSYFLDIYEGYGPLNLIQSNTTSYDLHTLKLDSLQEFGKDNKSLPSHKFNYFRPSYSYSEDRRPHRKCRDQDYWGYYNGAKNGESMIPELRSLFVDRIPSEVYLFGANREIHIESAKVGILEKITYPTGGYTTFEYESNDYSGHTRPEYARISRTKQILLTQSTSTQYSEDFNIVSSLNPVHIQIKGDIPCIDTYGNIIANCEATLMRLNPQNTNQVLEAFALVPGGFLKVPPGSYRIFGKLPQNQTMSMFVQIQWDETGAVMENKLGGGLRIKQLNFFDAISPATSFTKVYEYKEGTTTKSSGRHKSITNFYYLLTVDNFIPYAYGLCVFDESSSNKSWVGQLIVRTTSNYQQNETLQGSPIGYGEVKEYTSPFKNNANDFWRSYTGKIISKYYNPTESPTINSQVAFVPSIVMNKDELSKYGLLLNQTIHKYKQDGTYYKIKETIQQYDSLSFGRIWGLKIGRNLISNCYSIFCRIGADFQDYYSEGKWYFLKNTKEILYDEVNPSIALTTETQYEYNTQIQQIKKQIVLSNNSEKLITNYKYSIDYSSNINAGIDALKTKNIIAAPIEEQTWIEKAGVSKMLSGKITEYDAVAKPSKIHLFENTEDRKSVV